MDSGRDWALSGAKATGETVLARVGSKSAGNLSIVSPQDESFYQAKEQSYGINVSIPIYGSGSAPPSLGLSASGLKLLAENESIKQQSSIVAGIGGYDVRVNGHTHLKGGSNYFETQTLTHEDVINRDVASGKSWSVSVNISAGTSGAGAMAGSSVGFARMDTNETFITKSSIASPVNLTRPDLQAGKVTAMKSAERDPLAAARDQKQNQLNELLWNEPPSCDGCAYNSLPTTPVSTVAGGKGGVNSTTTSGINQTDKVSTPPIEGTDSNTQWRAWQAAVQALQNEINGLNTRISAVDAKVYQTTITTSPSGLHQPLLHTFDKTKATQELRDGVAVTAAFGKAAYKFAGDKSGEYEKQAKTDCAAGSASACKDVDRWGEGGLYRGALHAAIGGIAYGAPGAMGAGAGQAMLKMLNETQLLSKLGVTDPTAANLLTNLAVTLAGAAAGSTGGAASAFNADANNRQLHVNQTEAVKRRASQLAGIDGKSAYQWEVELTQQLLRQNDRSFAGFSENVAARATLADLQRTTGVSMSAEGTPAYDNPSINAEQLAANSSSYLAAGNLPRSSPRYDLLTYSYMQAVTTPQFAELSREKQREVLGQLIIWSESLNTNDKASPIQRRAADMAARYAAAWVRQTGAMPVDMPPIPAERRLGQSMTEAQLGGAIASAQARGKLLETQAGVLAGNAKTYDVPNEWGKGIKRQGDPWEDFWESKMPAGSRLPDGFPTFDFFDFATGRAVSNKTLDTTTASRQGSPEQLYYAMKKYIDKTSEFAGDYRSGVTVTKEMINAREIEVLVPKTTTTAQWTELARAVEYAQSRGVTVRFSKGN